MFERVLSGPFFNLHLVGTQSNRLKTGSLWPGAVVVKTSFFNLVIPLSVGMGRYPHLSFEKVVKEEARATGRLVACLFYVIFTSTNFYGLLCITSIWP
jgi:hypothetical protein